MPDSLDPFSDVQRVAYARAKLDWFISGYHRHSLMSEQFRRAFERFQQARARFEAVRSVVEETRAIVTERREARARNLERWREARAKAAAHRHGVEYNVREYVHSLRDEGMAREAVILEVQRRLVVAVSAAAADAPTFESSRLAADVIAWANSAYYDAA